MRINKIVATKRGKAGIAAAILAAAMGCRQSQRDTTPKVLPTVIPATETRSSLGRHGAVGALEQVR